VARKSFFATHAQAYAARPEFARAARMDEFIRIFAARGDLAHLALLLWATTASALALMALRELFASIRRFDDFVRELARFNDTFHGPSGDK
jgi:hypothetical protein